MDSLSRSLKAGIFVLSNQQDVEEMPSVNTTLLYDLMYLIGMEKVLVPPIPFFRTLRLISPVGRHHPILKTKNSIGH
jgi:hypothetical protein